MKVSKEQMERNRDRVIDNAAVLLRERGIDGIGIADLMRASGLTHGGFYRHFKSKEELVARAVLKAFEDMSADLSTRISGSDTQLDTLVRHYVSQFHRDNPGQGCSLTALAADAARRDDPELLALFGKIISSYIALLTSLVTEKNSGAKRSTAIALLAEMVGSVILSRAVPDEALSAEILDTVADDLLIRFGASPGR